MGFQLAGGGGADTITTVAASGTSQTLTLPASGLGTFDVTLTANCTVSLAGAQAGKACVATVLLRQDATGGRTVTWPASVVWASGVAPTLSTVANRVDTFTLMTVDNGVSWLAAISGSGFALPVVPGAPTGLSRAPGDTAMTLTWTAPAGASPAVTGYKVYRGTSSGTETLLTTLGNVTTFGDTGLTNGTTYYYKVSAVNAVGEGALSSEVSGTPVASGSLPTVSVAASQWFKADALALSDGASVASWTDSAASPQPVAQATGGNQPIFKTNIVAGKPVVRFDGVNDVLSGGKAWTQGFTVLAVVRQAATGGNYPIVGSPLGGNQVRIDTTSKLVTIITNSATMAQGTVAISNPTTQFHVLSASSPSSAGIRNVKLVVDGASETIASGGTNTTAGQAMCVGANDPVGSPFFNGDIAEIVRYDAELSDADRRSVEAYLAAKYGITVV